MKSAPQRSVFFRYGIAIITTTVAILIKLLYPVIGQRTPFLLGSLAVVLSALFGGLGPALLSGGLFTVVSGYFFVPPPHSFKVGIEGAVGMSVFSVEAALISWLVAARARSEETVHRLNAELDQRVRERTAQLEAVNHELEAFSHSVSHDLRQPLGTIDGYSHILLAEYGDQLGETGSDYVHRMLATTRQMGELIEELLQFSLARRAVLRREPLDLGVLAETVVAELRQLEPDRQITVAIAPALTAVGDRTLLRVVLQNLLGNAWKFTKKQPHPRIEVGALELDGAVAYFVCDNGVGFDMADAHKLFDAFQRLHDGHEFPGTGIGLATVQRIVDRHGGRVWAEGAIEQGATFYFTLSPTDHGR